VRISCHLIDVLHKSLPSIIPTLQPPRFTVLLDSIRIHTVFFLLVVSDTQIAVKWSKSIGSSQNFLFNFVFADYLSTLSIPRLNCNGKYCNYWIFIQLKPDFMIVFLSALTNVSNVIFEIWCKLWLCKSYIFFSFWRYSPNLGLGLPSWNSPFHFGLLDLRHSVGLLGRVISSSQGLYLHANTEKHTHTPNTPHTFEWESNPWSRLPRERRQCMP
jgi:hypothetical protein